MTTNNIELWVERNLRLRGKVVKEGVKEGTEKKYLLASFLGTEQQKDVEKRTPLINDHCRIKVNVKAFSDKEMEKKEREKKGFSPLDFGNEQEIFNALKQEFDMPYWAFTSIHKPLKDLANTFIYQLKACNLFCPWCFVDDNNKDGKDSSGGFFSIKEIMDMFEQEQKKQPLYNFRPSGGEPTLAIEQWPESLREIEKRKIDAYVQSDTNLTTGHLIGKLEETGRIEKNLLEKVAGYDNFGLLCSFKGTDIDSFLKATGFVRKDGSTNKNFAFLEEERWYTFSKLVKAGIDAYPFIYDPNPETLENFMENGAKLFGDGFYLKTWVIPLKLYSPEKTRLEKKEIDKEVYQKGLDNNFEKSKEIMQNLIWNKFGLNYQAVPRAGIKLKVVKMGK